MGKLVLNERELLLQSALSLVGITLPQEYVIRVVMLEDLSKEMGIGNIKISDGVAIERNAEREYEHRVKAANAHNDNKKD
jgi:hypothetical protein